LPRSKRAAPKRFIQRFSDKIIGVLSGFDRLVLRGSLRRIGFPDGMMSLLWHKKVLLKEFEPYVHAVTELLKEASCEAAHRLQRPVKYLESSKTDKEALARQIAQRDHVTDGLIAVISCVEPCQSFEIHRNPETKELGGRGRLLSSRPKAPGRHYLCIDTACPKRRGTDRPRPWEL